VLALGGLLSSAGVVLLLEEVRRLGTGGSAWWLVPGLAVVGAGMGLAVAPLTGTVLARVSDPRLAGGAAGVLSTVQQLGSAVGVAVMGLVFYGALGRTPPGGRGYGDAFRAGLYYSACVGVVLALLVQALPRRTADGRTRPRG
jgi:MFS family permease